jgi:hypothetical protein
MAKSAGSSARFAKSIWSAQIFLENGVRAQPAVLEVLRDILSTF